MPRIVSCNHCKTLTRMPDVTPGTPMIPARLVWTSGEEFVYQDEDRHPKMVPQFDPALEAFVERHHHGYPEEKFLQEEVIQVWAVDQKTWDSVDVVTKIKGELEAVTGQWYADRDEFLEEALKCYNSHGNPDMGNRCHDFQDDSKRIGPESYRDDDGHLHLIPNRFRQYLCYQCPYMQTHILTEQRWKKGLYK